MNREQKLEAALTLWADFARRNGWTDKDFHNADGTGWITLTEQALGTPASTDVRYETWRIAPDRAPGSYRIEGVSRDPQTGEPVDVPVCDDIRRLEWAKLFLSAPNMLAVLRDNIVAVEVASAVLDSAGKFTTAKALRDVAADMRAAVAAATKG